MRDAIAAAGKRYVLAVSANTPLWREPPPLEEPVEGATGRPRKKPRLAAGSPSWETAAAIVASLPKKTWRRLTVSEGEKGPRTRVVESRKGLPGPDGWLLARRSLSAPTDMAYYVSNAPRRTTLRTKAQVASTRCSFETTIEEGKGQAGLDEYEVRYWQSWHRHITLSMMAHAWLASIRQTAGEKTARPGLGRVERP